MSDVPATETGPEVVGLHGPELRKGSQKLIGPTTMAEHTGSAMATGLSARNKKKEGEIQ